MFMKHNATNRCEPSLEVIVKMGVRPGWGGVCSQVGCRGLCGVNAKKQGPGSGQGVRVDENQGLNVIHLHPQGLKSNLNFGNWLTKIFSGKNIPHIVFFFSCEIVSKGSQFFRGKKF